MFSTIQIGDTYQVLKLEEVLDVIPEKINIEVNEEEESDTELMCQLFVAETKNKCLNKPEKQIKKITKMKTKGRTQVPKKSKILSLKEFCLKCDCEVLGDYYKEVTYVSTYFLKNTKQL